MTRLSKALSAVLVVGYLTQLVLPAARQYTALIPGRFLPCVWSVFTAGLLETHVLKVTGGVLALLFLARRIEPVWGSREFLAFICLINLATGVATLALLYLLYYVSVRSEQAGAVLYKQVAGCQGIVAACLVGVKQVMPEDEITVLSYIKFRAKHLSFVYLVLFTVGGVAMHATLEIVPSVVFGTFLAWAYLRYLQPHSGALGRGDPSDAFRLATMFPEPLHPVVDKVMATCGSARATAPAAQESEPFLSSTPAGEDAETKRRRDRGAKALEARLGSKRGAPAPEPVGEVAINMEAPSEAQ